MSCCKVIATVAFIAAVAFVAYYLPPIVSMAIECSAGGCQ